MGDWWYGYIEEEEEEDGNLAPTAGNEVNLQMRTKGYFPCTYVTPILLSEEEKEMEKTEMEKAEMETEEKTEEKTKEKALSVRDVLFAAEREPAFARSGYDKIPSRGHQEHDSEEHQAEQLLRRLLKGEEKVSYKPV